MRLQQVIDAAVKYDRKVTVVGRSMSNNVNMALNMGYLKAPSGVIVSMKESRQLPHDKVIIMATGSQGEPTSALVRISNAASPSFRAMVNARLKTSVACW